MKKILTVTLGVILLLCVFAFFGFRSFVSSIREQRTCEWANIDNIELHAHIDIPKIISWDCSYDQPGNTKQASFTVDRSKVNVDYYINSNKLQLVGNVDELNADRFLKLNKAVVDGANLYTRVGSGEQHEYAILFDKSSGTLWVTIKFND